MNAWLKNFALIVALALWLVVIFRGASIMLSYAMLPGEAMHTLSHWPQHATIQREPGRMTLLMFLHPRCPCSHASLEQLQRVLVASPTRVASHIVFVIPPGLSESAATGPLMTAALQVPGLTIMRDDGAVEVTRFGALTSGHVLLYGRDGDILFSGGITGSRGHIGACQGSQALTELLNGMNPLVRHTPVYGCPLFERNTTCPEECSQ